MANSEKDKGSIKAYLQNLFSAKESKTGKDAPAQSDQDETKDAQEGLGSTRKSSCCKNCFAILFVLLSLIAVIEAISEIVVTVSTAIFTKLYGSEHSGRLVGMILLALLAAVTISMLLNSLVAVFRNQTRSLHAASIVLFVVAAMQAIVLGMAVRVTPEDELQLIKSLQTSFQLAKENNPRHSGIWSATQYELSCCGLYGPEDYRSSNMPNIFAPNVPISCCPSYDPNRSELVQEREREICKSRKSFYREGCENVVVEGFKTSAELVLGVTVALIVLEVLLSIFAEVLVRKIKKQKSLRPVAEPEKSQASNP